MKWKRLVSYNHGQKQSLYLLSGTVMAHCTISCSVMGTCHWLIDHPITFLLSAPQWDQLNKWLRCFISNKVWPLRCSNAEWLYWPSGSTAPSRRQHSLQPGATTELTTKGQLLIVWKYVIVFKRKMTVTSSSAANYSYLWIEATRIVATALNFPYSDDKLAKKQNPFSEWNIEFEMSNNATVCLPEWPRH